MDLKSLLILKGFFILTLYFNPVVEGDIPYGLCANSECSEPVGLGFTMLKYASPDDSRISVAPNEEVVIYVKEYGPKKDLWGVMVRGNKGYISKAFIRETKTLVKQLVPAQVEFRSVVLLTEGYTVTSHLHVSSYHQSGTPSSSSESIIHSQTLQQDFVNSAPSSLLQSNPNENLQASHSGLLSSLDPSQLHNVPEYSSQLGGGNNFVSSHVTDVRFESNVIPSHSPVAGVRDPSFHNDLSLYSHYPEDGINSMHNFDPASSLHFSQGAALDPNSVHPSHAQQSFSQYPSSISQQMHQEHTIYASELNINQHPSSIHLQQQQFPSQHSPEMHMNQHPSSIQFQQQQFPSQNSPEMHMNQHPSSIQFQQQQFPSQNSPEMHMNQQPSSVQFQQQQFPSQNSPEMLMNQHPSSIQLQQQQYQSQISPEMSFNHDPSIVQSQQQQYQSPLPEMNFNEHHLSIQQQQMEQQLLLQSQHMSQIHHNPQLSSVQQQQQVQSQDLSEMQSAMHSPNYFEPLSDDDIEKTLAMLSDRGIDPNYLYSDSYSESQGYHTAPNIKPDIGASRVEVNPVPGQSQHSSMHTNEALLHSSLNPNLNDESKIINSQVSEESILKPPENSDLKTESAIVDKTPVDLVDLEKENEELEAEILAESEEESDEDEEVLEDNNVTNDDSVSSSENKSSNSETVMDKDNFLDLGSEANEKKISENEPLSENTDATSEVENFIDPNIAQEKNSFGNKEALSDMNNKDDLQTENFKDHVVPSISDFFMENEHHSDLTEVVNTVGIEKVGDNIRSIYQNRNLKGEYTTEEQQLNSEKISEENKKDADSSYFNSFQNGLLALKSFIDSILSWIPEPLYSYIMDLQNKGISPRVPVFTTLFGIVCIFLIVPLFYIKESSKESKLISQLASVEKKAYTLSATNNALEEKLESVQTELNNLQVSLKEEKAKCENLTLQYENQAADLELTKSELETCLEEIEVLKAKEIELMAFVQDHSKKMENLLEHKNSLDKIITDQENSIESLTNQLQERENDLKELENEKTKFLQLKEDYEDKIALFDKNCNQLLQEAEVWNLRVNELTSEVNEEKSLKNELEASLKEKNEEIESLKNLVETFESFEAIEDSEDELKTKEEKLQCLINSSKILNQLKKEEDKTKVLEDQLGTEKNKILDMEVELLDAKSEIDKLKLSYNQALQDKAEAQTKLDVLTNYFKDKEIQLQKQLGVQEAFRQKKEEDASSAERRICLIEQENASYKFQVASMKQEMEETERNLKSQIAAQEKKAHENWIAARGAERKLEDMKQEVTQLRQRLTLLEREQENWNNSMRDDIIRPVPKRIPGTSEETGSQDLSISERGMFPRPPPLHDPLPPLPPMMLPPDRPLPPLPPPMPPMFLPPMERHFRPQPWQHLPPDPNSDYRTTPPDFGGGRASTPPRGRQPMHTDGDAGPNTSSPLTTDPRDSRNSTPPHLLPDFHDIPPQPGRPFFPPPPHLGHPRLPMHPQFRRDPLPPKRLDNSNEYNSSRGSQQSSSQEQWQHSRV